MKRREVAGRIVALAVAMAGIAYAAYQVGMTRGMGISAVTTPIVPATEAPRPGERKVLYWHDPMVPGQRFDKPGKSPFMDMQLVPVYADEAQGAGVSVSPTVAQNLGLRTALVRKAPLASTFDVAGTVVINERSTVVVQSRTAGYVEKLSVRATLDPVAKGQALATFYSPEWAGAIAEYLALRKANIDPTLVSAARARLTLLSIPDEVIADSEREGIARSRFTLVSPISGVVAELGAREGVMVQPGMVLFRLVDLSSVWIEASVPEAQAAEVRMGSTAFARATSLPGRTFSGKVAAILPQVDAATRTLRARVELANPGLALKPGMFVNVTIGAAQPLQALVVPQEAVIATGKRSIVIVADEGNRFLPTEVTLGRPVGADVEVTSGLAEGQRVVTSGQFLIDSEASLKAALPRLDSASQPTGGSASKTYRGEGRIEAVRSDEITLSHGPIPALQWPSMTMAFKAPAAGVPHGLGAGDAVEFEFLAKDGSYEITRIDRAGRKP
jgi:membrane fusion protein, copper/silver efflux system